MTRQKIICGTKELLKYSIVGILAFVITGTLTGTLTSFQLAGISAFAYVVAMIWVVFHFNHFRKERKLAFIVFLLSGVILLKQVFEFLATGHVVNNDLWWIVDTAIALFALMIAITEKRYER